MGQAVGRGSVEPDIDPDLDPADPPQPTATGRGSARSLGAVALGGILGAEARYGLSRTLPHRPAAFRGRR